MLPEVAQGQYAQLFVHKFSEAVADSPPGFGTAEPWNRTHFLPAWRIKTIGPHGARSAGRWLRRPSRKQNSEVEVRAHPHDVIGHAAGRERGGRRERDGRAVA